MFVSFVKYFCIYLFLFVSVKKQLFFIQTCGTLLVDTYMYQEGGSNMQEISNVITTVGFPSGMCVILCYFLNTQMKDMQKTIENNTVALTKLIDKLGDKNE